MTKFSRAVLVNCVALALCFSANAQSVSINTDGSTAHASALLDVKSSTKGVLVPRMTKTEKNAIAAPANGLVVYQTGPDSIGFHYYDLPNTRWVYINASGFASDTTAWKTTGNNNITAANFLGTLNDSALYFRVKNQKSGSIDSINLNTSFGYGTQRSLTQSGGLNGKTNSAFGYRSMDSTTTGYYNNAFGYNSMLSNTTGWDNTVMGNEALKANKTGSQNTAFGAGTLFKNTTSWYNTAVGEIALYENKTTDGNTALGAYALSGHITNPYNTAVGFEAMRYDTSGWLNTAVGWRSMFQSRKGVENTAVGVGSLENDSSGNQNVAVGRYAGYGPHSGSFNIWMGYSSGHAADTADLTVSLGTYSGYYNKIDYNTAVGAYSLTYNSQTASSNTQGAENTGLGYGSGYGINLGSKNTAIGFQSMNGGGSYVNGNRNVGVGDSTLFNFTTGNDNVAMGYRALSNAFSSSQNVAIGSKALTNFSGGYPNTAVGYLSMDSVTTGTANTALGSYSLSVNKIGINNVALGNAAMYQSTTGNENTAIGNDAGRLIRANGNSVVGASALRNDSTGSYNIAMGYQASYENDTASFTVAIGPQALYYNTLDSNIAVGYRAGYFANSAAANPSKEQTFLGTYAGVGSFASSKNTAIGFKALMQYNAAAASYTDYTNGGRNTAIGDSALAAGVGAFNVAVGTEVMSRSGLSTFRNVGIGDSAMANSVSPVDNVGVGYKSLANIRNQGNTAMGAYSLQQGTNTVWNTAIGYHALETDSTGSENTAIGTSAFRLSAKGVRNTGVGINAGYYQKESYNTFIGAYSGVGERTPGSNYAADTGNYNTGLGSYSLHRIADGSNNVAVGYSAMYYDSTGTLNTAVGNGALYSNTGSHTNSAFGWNALYSYNNTTNGWNNAFGDRAAEGLTSGTQNVMMGSWAMITHTSGSFNTAMGNYVMGNGTGGSYNTALGASALWNTGSDNNVGIGSSAGSTNTTGTNNTLIGAGSDVLATNLTNATAIGSNSRVAASNSLVLGASGVNVGINETSPNARLHIVRSGTSGGTYHASSSMIIEDNTNSYLQFSNPTANETGFLSGNALTTIRSAMIFRADSTIDLRSGGNNTRMTVDNNGYIGIGTTSPLTKTHIYEAASANVNLRVASVGSGFEPGLELVKTTSGGSDWKLRVTTGGNLVVSRSTDDFVTPTDEYQFSAGSFIPTTDNSNSLGLVGNRWTAVYAVNGTIQTSDARDKENINDLSYGLNEIMKLRPVTFNWKDNPQWGKKLGFIAQEVQPILKEVVQAGALKTKAALKDDNGNALNPGSDKLGIYYSDIIPVTVKAIQEQQQLIIKQQQEISNLKNSNEKLQKDILSIKTKLGIKE